jgi:HEAT repeat protein
VDQALADALVDDSSEVRQQVLTALGRRGASGHASAIAERFMDPAEDPRVRGAAVSALSALCDPRHVDAMTRAVRQLLAPRPTAADVVVGRAALQALGQLAPERLVAFRGQQGHPLSLAAEQALARERRCNTAGPSAVELPERRLPARSPVRRSRALRHLRPRSPAR